MATEHPHIEGLFIAEADSLLTNNIACVSIGVALSNGRVGWGECLPVEGLVKGDPTIRRLIDLCERRLGGQSLNRFRDLCHLINSVFPDSGRMPKADSVRGAIEQALLGAVASNQGVSEHELLKDEFELESTEVDRGTLSIIIMVNDFEATAESISQILNMRPAGIGYRLTSELVAESIGTDAEYLIDFVGGISQIARSVSNDGDRSPEILLSLNGAFGQLAEDPIRNIGKILAICRDLEDAAGSCQLILEDVFILADPMEQAANIGRLKKLMVQAPRPQNGINRAQLVITSKLIREDSWPVYRKNQPVDGIVFEPLLLGSIQVTMGNYASIQGSRGVAPLISYSHPTLYNVPLKWLDSASELLLATSCAHVVLDSGNELATLIDTLNRATTKMEILNRQ